MAQVVESGPPAAMETPKSSNATSSRSSRDRPRRNHHHHEQQHHEQHHQQQHHSHRGDSNTSRDSRFSCNICLDHVQEPVVTQCGHLYCWPCLYRWLEPGMSFEERLGLVQQSQTTTVTTTPAMQYQYQQQQLNLTAIPMPSRRVCPVCKADCAVSTIVPIYVRNHDEQDTADENQFHDNDSDLNDERLVELDNDDEHHVKRDSETREEEEKDPTSTTGLRLRFRSRDSVIPSPESGSPERPNSQDDHDYDEEEEEAEPPQVLPSRPTPLISSPARRNVSYHQQNNNSGRPTANAATNTTPMMGMTMPAASGPTNSLSQGLAFTLQAFLSQNLVNSNMSGSGTSSTFIPPLHRPTTRGGGGGETATTSSATTSQQVTTAAVPSFQGHQWGDVPSDDSATEFLSRILLLLGSFVVLCLLLC